MRLSWSRLLFVVAGPVVVAALSPGCGRDDSTVLAADCSMCAEDVQSQCIDTYSQCIQGGDDSASCQSVINAFCTPDGGADGGDGGDAASDSGDGAANAG